MVAVEQGARHTWSPPTQRCGLKEKSDSNQIIRQVINCTQDKCNRGKVWWIMRAHSQGIWRGDNYSVIQKMRKSWPRDKVHEVPPTQKKHQTWMSRRSLVWWPVWLDQWSWVGVGAGKGRPEPSSNSGWGWIDTESQPGFTVLFLFKLQWQWYQWQQQ